MKHFITVLFLLSLPFHANAEPYALSPDVVTHQQGKHTRIDMPESLKSTHTLSCLPLNQAKNQYTPADLYPAMADCIRQSRLAEATDIFLLAGVFGYYDRARVTDTTAHQAPQMLILENLGPLDPKLKEKWKVAISQKIDNTEDLSVSCTQIKKIGKPDYQPVYMIQHGMNALNAYNREAPLVANFDAEKTWQEALTKYAHCP